ncbi:L-aspartate oxidase [Dictyobacter alpinus]|uniref:L-aspartate oxidase n=1 Tax=Dictyobacter alpinus TaxID=2014873 RepID=A0A402B0I7_9CHLR|nr:L-aspartate oxidase [Dictyobacter alpinus]GCE24860.1 L-aspartate oxidase [Dictyobacter alpinus]
MTHCQPFDVAIIGGGIAGLSVALRLPEHVRVALFTKGKLGESNTRYAQGGLAVALGDDDSPELHLQDTLAAGAGLCDEDAVRILVEQAPASVRWLIEMGVQFDRAQAGEDAHTTPDGLLLGREGAHCRWRVLHAGGDATGAEIERALLVAVQARSSIELYEETFVQNILLRDGRCAGLHATRCNGESFDLYASSVVLASGGAGGLWLHTSNPAGATADGLALAWRAGAALTDLEFMQFHPTVLVAGGSSHLISEAVRGEGAYLRNHAGERFMPRYSPQEELAPRDVVARAILNEMLTEKTDYQYLDLRHLPSEKMHARFPTISAFCQQYGLDLTKDLLPVAPAAHYCMGGVLVDTYGRTTVDGLYAVGEVSCTGVHGANRLASNSLLEGLVYGIRIADHLAQAGRSESVKSSSLERSSRFFTYDDALESISSSSLTNKLSTAQVTRQVRQLMWQYVSLGRDHEGLLVAKQQIRELRSALQSQEGLDIHFLETLNMLLVSELVITAALERRESRGSHWRLDYQFTDQDLAARHLAFVPLRIDPYGSMVQQKEAISCINCR